MHKKRAKKTSIITTSKKQHEKKKKKKKKVRRKTDTRRNVEIRKALCYQQYGPLHHPKVKPPRERSGREIPVIWQRVLTCGSANKSAHIPRRIVKRMINHWMQMQGTEVLGAEAGAHVKTRRRVKRTEYRKMNHICDDDYTHVHRAVRHYGILQTSMPSS